MRKHIANFSGKIVAEFLVALFFLASLPIQLVVVSIRAIKQYRMNVPGPQDSLEKQKGFLLLREAVSSRTSKFSWQKLRSSWRKFSFPTLPWDRISLPNISLPFSLSFHQLGKKHLVVAASAVLLTGGLIWWNSGSERTFETEAKSPLYLIEEASEYVEDAQTFESKVRWVAWSLDVPPEWVMAVMYSESRFDSQVKNFKGSGATGLIQFMVPAVKDLNARLGTSLKLSDVQAMTPIHQLDLVHEYLQTMRERYRDYESLTDLYLAILYPRALEGSLSYILYAKPSRAYRQNSGLDENKDGKVTASDIDQRMQRLYPDAYLAVQ
jgi:hypothetical protein